MYVIENKASANNWEDSQDPKGIPPRNKTPSVSVIITVFNSAEKVGRAIESALAQTYPGVIDVIVADDGSTDATSEVLERYAGQITMMHLPHRGVAATRNTAVRASRGELLAFLDADDTWLPQKLVRTVRPLVNDPKCVLACHDGFQADIDGTITLRSSYPASHTRAPSLEELISYSSPGLPILFDSVVVRRGAFDLIGGFNEELGSAEDVWFLMNAREIGHFHYIAESLMVREIGISPRREEWYINGAFALRDLIQKRYGPKFTSGQLEIVLKWAAREALRRDERQLARRRYLAATFQRPLQIKGWLALIATFFPLSLIRVLAPTRFAPRLADGRLSD